MSVDLNAIGISGILAAETGFATTESNLANANDPNYSVESVNLAPLAGGVDGVGAGVEVLGVDRAQVPFLSAEINQTESSQSFNQAYAQALQPAESIVAPSSGDDIGQAVQNLFNAFSTLAASPEDASARDGVLSAATNFAQLVQTTSSSLGQAAAQTAAGVGSMVAQVNDLTQQIAQLNVQINGIQAGGGSAAAVLDQRDGLASQLANLVGASIDASGNVTLNGVPLVSGGNALELSTTGSGANLGLQVTLPKGSIQILTSQVGGQIGGQLSGAAALTNLQTSVDNFATSVANAINAQQEKGFGLDGSTGNALFVVPGSVGPITLNPAINSQNLAAASSAAGVPGDGSNAQAIAALAGSIGGDSAFPTSTFGQAFAQVGTQLGATLQNAQNTQSQAAATLSSLNQLKSSVTGVSVNDQLAQLVQYQNQLQAVGRALQAANDSVTFLIQAV
jgi:flagellar hook-associated protein 1 FlgK